MKTKLLICLLPLLSGCNNVASIANSVPPNSFDKISFGVSIGPFNHTTTLTGGEKQSNGEVKIQTAVGSTTFMGWGSSVDIVNLVVLPSTPAVTAAAK